MKTIPMGNTDIMITPVGIGVLTIGNTQLNLPLAEGAKIVRYSYDKGIRIFDTAQFYETYSYIKEAFRDIDMSSNNPDRPVIASKSLVLSYGEMEDAIQECLEVLDIETIDIFKLHEVREDPDFDERAGAWQCLLDYKEKGIVRAIGVSTHNVDVVNRMADIPDCDIVFPLINYAGLGIRRGPGPGTADEMAAAIRNCLDNGKTVFGMKAFGGGNLTGSYMKALNYVRDTGVQTMMIGFGKKSEIDDIVNYAEGKLPEDYQPEVSFKKIRIDQGDCEGCGACIEKCESRAIFRNELGLADVDHDKCLTCGYCAPVCPVRAIIMW